MYVILVSYRARGTQTFRREELKGLIQNVNDYFTQNRKEYKIVICEQNDDRGFNRGALLNIAFMLSENLFRMPLTYIHMNADYRFNTTRRFPDEITNFKSGFLEMFALPYPVLGSACVFDANSYRQINGFPNDLWGWGGDDWAIYNRIHAKHIVIDRPSQIHDNGFITEIKNPHHETDQSKNVFNINLAHRNDLETNGINSCKFKVDGICEFHNATTVFHYLVSF